jgi:hypothetical protein
MSSLIEEKDLFSALILNTDHDDAEIQDVMSNTALFFSRVNQNIFQNEYYAIYEAIKRTRQYGGLIKEVHFNQQMLGNMESLIKNPNVHIGDFAEDISDEYQTKKDFLALCLDTFRELTSTIVSRDDFRVNLELYIEDWAKKRYLQAHTQASTILNIGMQVGKRTLVGPAASEEYYTLESSKIRSVLYSDATQVGRYEMSPEGLEDNRNNANDLTTLYVTNTGVSSIDTALGDVKLGDCIVTVGGSGAGKTRKNVNYIYNGMMRGFNVVEFFLEMSKSQHDAMYIAKHIVEQRYEPNGFITDRMIAEKSYPEKYRDLVESARHDLFTNPKYGRLSTYTSLYLEDFKTVLEQEWDEVRPFHIVSIDYLSRILGRDDKSTTQRLEIFANILANEKINFKGQGFAAIVVEQLKPEIYEKFVQAVKEQNLEKIKEMSLYGTTYSSATVKGADRVGTIFSDDDLKANKTMLYVNTKSRNDLGFGIKKIYASFGSCVYRELEEG